MILDTIKTPREVINEIEERLREARSCFHILEQQELPSPGNLNRKVVLLAGCVDELISSVYQITEFLKEKEKEHE